MSVRKSTTNQQVHNTNKENSKMSKTKPTVKVDHTDRTSEYIEIRGSEDDVLAALEAISDTGAPRHFTAQDQEIWSSCVAIFQQWGLDADVPVPPMAIGFDVLYRDYLSRTVQRADRWSAMKFAAGIDSMTNRYNTTNYIGAVTRSGKVLNVPVTLGIDDPDPATDYCLVFIKLNEGSPLTAAYGWKAVAIAVQPTKAYTSKTGAVYPILDPYNENVGGLTADGDQSLDTTHWLGISKGYFSESAAIEASLDLRSALWKYSALARKYDADDAPVHGIERPDPVRVTPIESI